MAPIRRALVLLTKPGGDRSPWAAASTPALASVGNRTILDWVLADLADAGVEDVGLVVSDATAADVRSVAGDGRAWRLRCSYIEEQASLGAGGALLTAESFLG